MNVLLICIVVLTYMMVISRRITTLINGFMLQSIFLFLLTFMHAVQAGQADLYFVAVLVLAIKVILIPYFLHWIVKKINIDQNLGLLVTPMLSMLMTVVLSYLAYVFATEFLGGGSRTAVISFTISLSVILSGLFLMVFRMKAIAQVVGLLVIENGLFLSAVSLCGNMPFFVEVAIFFDIFVFVIILGVFVFRINELFTHIDVDKMTKLKG